MSESETDRRSVLRTSGTALAALCGVSLGGNAAADAGTDCLGCDDGGDDGGGGGSTGSKPSVRTRQVEEYSDYAVMYGSVESLGSESSADAWIEWGPKGDGLPYDTDIAIMYSVGFYSGSTFDGLSGTYEYRAVASNSWGKAEGSIKEFTL